MGWLRAQGSMNGSLLASDDCDVGLLRSFGLTDSLPGAAALAMGAGLDQELCVSGDGRGQAFVFAADAVASGALAQAALDRAAANSLRGKFAAGLFDGRALVGYDNLPRVLTPAAVALARRAAAESLVLLKTSPSVLPLRYSPAAPITVAVVGPNAGCGDNATACDATRSQCGGYTNEGASVTTALQAAYAEAGVRVVFAAGCAVGGNDTSGFAAALAAARAASVILFVGGDSGGLGWNKNTCGEDDDRADLDLPGVQADLVAALAATGTPLVLALVHGRPVSARKGRGCIAARALAPQRDSERALAPQSVRSPSRAPNSRSRRRACAHRRGPQTRARAAERALTVAAPKPPSFRQVTSTRADAFGAAAAIIAMWRPGSEGGAALWDVLSGRTSPSGRLAQAWVRSVGQVHSMASPSFRLLQGDFDGSPYVGDANAMGVAVNDARVTSGAAFPFGAGLSYTTFALALSNVSTGPQGITSSVRVTNTGAMPSKTVIFVYFSRASPSAFVRHHARLLAFAKTAALAPGESADLDIVAPAAAIASWDPLARASTVEPGVYTVSVGFDSVHLPFSANITF
jgi:beta-glucosidase